MGCFGEEGKAGKGRHLDDLGRNGHKKGQLCLNTLLVIIRVWPCLVPGRTDCAVVLLFSFLRLSWVRDSIPCV